MLYYAYAVDLFECRGFYVDSFGNFSENLKDDIFQDDLEAAIDAAVEGVETIFNNYHFETRQNFCNEWVFSVYSIDENDKESVCWVYNGAVYSIVCGVISKSGGGDYLEQCKAFELETAEALFLSQVENEKREIKCWNIRNDEHLEVALIDYWSPTDIIELTKLNKKGGFEVNE